MVRRCQGRYTQRPPHTQCTRVGTFFVTYFTDGNGAKWSCAQHLAQVVRAVDAAASGDSDQLGGNVIKVVARSS
jgi:hypothetical protein